MKVDLVIDSNVDMLYFKLTDRKVDKSTETRAIIDFDSDGNIVGVEVFGSY